MAETGLTVKMDVRDMARIRLRARILGWVMTGKCRLFRVCIIVSTSLFWVLVSSRPSSALRQRDSSLTLKEDEAICCWRNTAHAHPKDLTFHDSAAKKRFLGLQEIFVETYKQARDHCSEQIEETLSGRCFASHVSTDTGPALVSLTVRTVYSS